MELINAYQCVLDENRNLDVRNEISVDLRDALRFYSDILVEDAFLNSGEGLLGRFHIALALLGLLFFVLQRWFVVFFDEQAVVLIFS